MNNKKFVELEKFSKMSIIFEQGVNQSRSSNESDWSNQRLKMEKVIHCFEVEKAPRR